MFRYTSVERVSNQMLVTGKQLESLLANDKTEVSRFRADGTITLVDLDICWRQDFVLDQPTMTSAAVGNHGFTY